MLCAPADLVKKSQALINGWERYQLTPSFENFVELAVSINSFTEFLIDKGASALHHSSHQLEQVALALFNEEVNHPLSPAAWADLNDRIVVLTRIIDEHVAVIESLVERRQDTQPTGHGRRASGIWLIGHDREIWQDLLTQLDYFGMAVEFLHWDEPMPESISGDPLLLLDISSLPQDEWERRIKALRQQFAIGQLICLAVRSDFEQLQIALRMGCDGCQPEGTPLHTIVAQILELNERQEQEAFRVLIVEDSVTASRVIQHTLEEHQIITQAITDPRHVLNTLRQFNPDLILMDMYMPGHPVGDQIIRSLAWLLKQRLRKQNILCRYGGEEFLIGLPHTTLDQAFHIVDSIRHDFSQIRHPHGDTYFCTSASGGIATFPGFDSSDALIKAADDALYAAKKAGRNRIQRAE